MVDRQFIGTINKETGLWEMKLCPCGVYFFARKLYTVTYCKICQAKIEDN